MPDSESEIQSKPKGTHSSPRHALVTTSIYLLSLLAGACLLGSVLPFPDIPGVGDRFQYFAEHRNDYDTIFIGSSRFRHQVIPEVFETHAKMAGMTTHAFNLGYSGMWPPESYYFLRRVLDLKPAHLKYVVIELMDYRYGQVDSEPATERSVYWHDGPHTAMALRLIWELPLPLSRKLHHCATHSALFVRQLMHPGRGIEWLRDQWQPAKKKAKQPRWARRGGYEAQEESSWSEAARISFTRQVEAAQASFAPRAVRPGFAADLRKVVDDVRRAGAEPLFVIPPSVRSEENLAIGLPPGLPVFAFNQPAEYPILYRPETHYDPGHLNEKGAIEFSRLIAERFAKEVRR